MRPQRPLILAATLAALMVVTPDSGSASDLVTTIDELGAFSLTHPVEWTAVTTASETLSQIGLFASAPLDISIVAVSRPLAEVERTLEPVALLDQLVLSTVDNQGALGNQVIDAGRVDPLVEGSPAFSVIATDAERRKMITCWRFVVDGRLYTLTTMTDNSQASPDLGAAVRRVVESFSLLQPAERR